MTDEIYQREREQYEREFLLSSLKRKKQVNDEISLWPSPRKPIEILAKTVSRAWAGQDSAEQVENSIGNEHALSLVEDCDRFFACEMAAFRRYLSREEFTKIEIVEGCRAHAEALTPEIVKHKLDPEIRSLGRHAKRLDPKFLNDIFTESVAERLESLEANLWLEEENALAVAIPVEDCDELGRFSNRTQDVDAYLQQVFEKTGKKLNRGDLWKSHYKDDTEFGNWQRGSSCNRTARKLFDSILRNRPHLDTP